jgi:hypothetical protein
MGSEDCFVSKAQIKPAQIIVCLTSAFITIRLELCLSVLYFYCTKLFIVLYIPGKLKPGGPSPLAAGLLMALSGITHCK